MNLLKLSLYLVLPLLLGLVQTHGQTEDPEVASGLDALKKKDFREAIRDFSTAISSNSPDSRLYLWRGIAYNGLGDYEDGIADETSALALNPNFADALVLRGEAYLAEGKVDLAIADESKAQVLKPGFPQACMTLIASYIKQNNQEAALKEADHVIKADPNNALAYYYRGSCDLAMGKMDEAIDAYTACIKLNKLPAAYEGRSHAYFIKLDYVRALADLDLLIQIAPKSPDGFRDRAVIYEAQHLYDKAVVDLSTALTLNPKDFLVYKERGDVYTQLNAPDKALADFTQAEALAPQDPRCANALGWFLATCSNASFRNGAKALEYANKACAATQGMDPGFVDTLAAAYAESGDFNNAVKYEQSLLDKPLNPELLADFKTRLALYQAHQAYHEATR
jgi:tetratricopeptide (TPR) repeat protein